MYTLYMSERHEKCAVFGIYGTGLDVARLSFFGLFALQHRGQESSGIAVADGTALSAHKGMGLVSSVYAEEDIKKLTGHIAIGHNRYSTAGGSRLEHTQPILVNDGTIAFAHNGNLPSVAALETFLRGKGIAPEGMSDSRLMAEVIGVFAREGASLQDAVRQAYPLFTGAFSALVLSRDEMIAIRDHCGIRPLCIGRLNGGFCFASETCALQTIGATYEREVEPGEMVVVGAAGMRSVQLAEADPKLDMFEFVYFARPDSRLLGQSVYEVRKRFGETLARERPLPLDVIIPVPDTAIPVAIGYAAESGVPFEMGLSKNRYIHRTFIQPEQHVREQGVKLKLSPVIEVIAGKRIGVVDDSIVRGTTSRQIVKMLFEAGAKEVHFLVSSPPVMFPDFYGIDTSRQRELIAAVKTIDQMRDFLAATSLTFLSFNGMVAATRIPRERFCTSCFTGEYPIDIKERAREFTEKKVCYTPFGV